MSRNDRLKGKKLFAAALAVLLCLSGHRVGASEDLLIGAELAAEEVNYKTTVVARGEYVQESIADGFMSYRNVYTVAYEYNGAKFVKYLKPSGSQVTAGDELIELRVEGSAAELERMELELQRAEEETQRGIRDLEEQISDAKEDRALSAGYAWELKNNEVKRLAVELDRYKLQRERTVAQLRKTLEEEQERRAAIILKAQGDGIFSYGEAKAPDDDVYKEEELGWVMPTDDAEIRAWNDDRSFRYGMRVTVSLGGTDYNGRIVSANDILDGTAPYSALVELDDADAQVARGASYIRVKGQTVYLDNVLVTARDAVIEEPGDTGRYSVTKLNDGMAQKRYVTFGQHNVTDAWIVDGVTEGDVLIVN